MGAAPSVVAESTLQPATPVGRVPLSYADTGMGQSYIRVVVFYPLPAAQWDAAVASLTAALAAAVNDFPHLAAALEVRADGADLVTPGTPPPDGAVVVAPSGGVRLTVQTCADVSLASLAARDFALDALPEPLTAATPVLGAGDPLCAVHITQLGDDGLALGVAVHHFVADGPGIAVFAAAWAAYARGATAPPVPPVHDRSLLQALCAADGGADGGADDADDRRRYAHEFSTDGAGRYRRDVALGAAARGGAFAALGMDDRLRSVAVRVTKPALAALRAAAASQLAAAAASSSPSSPPPPPLSANDVLSAWLWTCITRARQLPPDTSTKLASACDVRGRLTPPLPAAYFGNANFAFCVEATAGALVDAPLGVTAAAVRRRLAGVDTHFVRAALRFVAAQPHRCDVPVAFRCSYGPDVGITNWSRFPIYGADFGFGRPCRVRTPVSMHEGHVTVLPGDFDADVAAELLIHLTKADMARLAADPAFLAVVPDAAATLGGAGDAAGGELSKCADAAAAAGTGTTVVAPPPAM